MILTVHFFCWWLSGRLLTASSAQERSGRLVYGSNPASADEAGRFTGMPEEEEAVFIMRKRKKRLSLICQIKSRWTIAHQSVKNELSCLFQAPIIDERTHRLVSRVTHRNILGFLVL